MEYTSLTRAGLPIMVPLTPFLGQDQLSVDVSTGLTYPAKAERSRRNPKVCLLFSDAVGSGLTNPPIVMVQGLATVRDAEIQANTDRYVRLALPSCRRRTRAYRDSYCAGSLPTLPGSGSR